MNYEELPFSQLQQIAEADSRQFISSQFLCDSPKRISREKYLELCEMDGPRSSTIVNLQIIRLPATRGLSYFTASFSYSKACDSPQQREKGEKDSICCVKKYFFLFNQNVLLKRHLIYYFFAQCKSILIYVDSTCGLGNEG
jgi:hypothetical protein